jgi:transposase-like protein
VGRKCKVCISPLRAEIDAAAISPGTSIREVAERYQMSYSSMARHVENHLPQLMSRALRERQEKGEHELFDDKPPVPPAIKDLEDKEQQLGDSLLDRVTDLERQAKEILGEARAAKSLKTALMAIGKAAELIELEAKVIGKIKEAQVQVDNRVIYLTVRQSEEEWAKQTSS